MTDGRKTMFWKGQPITDLDLPEFTAAIRHAFAPVPHSLHYASPAVYDAWMMDRVLCQEACRREGIARLAATVERRA